MGPIARVQLRMGPIGCPETSVRNCHHSLRNNPEENSFQALIVFVIVVLCCDVILATISNVNLVLYTKSYSNFKTYAYTYVCTLHTVCVCVCVLQQS